MGDLGLYVAPSCNPNERQVAVLSDKTVMDMLAQSTIDRMTDCKKVLSHRQVGSCAAKKAVNIVWNCKIEAGGDLYTLKYAKCPAYVHRDKGSGNVQNNLVYVNKKIVHPSLDRPAFAICTYIKQCVKKHHDQEQSLKVGSDIQFIALGEETSVLSKQEVELQKELDTLRAEEDKIRKENEKFTMTKLDKAKVEKIVAEKMRAEDLKRKKELVQKLEHIEKARIEKEKA